MTLPEPTTLHVGLSAWRLAHTASSPGSHKAPDDCFWAPTPDCTFTVSVATTLNATDTDFAAVPLVPASSVTSLPALDPVFAPQTVAEVPLTGAPPVLIRIKAEPTAKVAIKGEKGLPPQPDPIATVGFFEGTAFFVYEGQGIWKRRSRSLEEDEELSADLFAPPMTLAGTVQGPFVFTLIPFFLSRVRDRTRRALAALAPRDGRRTLVDASAAFEHLDLPPVADGKVRMRQTTIDLDDDCRVLEVKGFKAPALVAVCWPRQNDREPPTGVAPFFRAASMESLVFFHASFGQNAAIYNSTPYPFGLEQIDHGFTSYLNPAKHPLRRVYPFGLPYQVAAAGKRAVTLLPLNRVQFPELTNLNDGEQAAELLEEIHAAYLRFSGRYFTAPRLGRMALASFSAGIQEMMLFHRRASASPLLKALIEEVYIFEPIHSNNAQVANYAAAFKSWAGGSPARRVRVYSNEPGPGLASFVGQRSLPTPPFVVDSADGRFTTGVVTDRNWQDSAQEPRDRFLFDLRRPAPFTTTVVQSAPAGATSLLVKAVGPIKAGEVVAHGAEAHRVTAVAGKLLTLDNPLTAPLDRGSGVVHVDRIAFRTTLTDAIAPGDRALTVAEPAGFLEDVNVIVGNEVLTTVGGLKGNVIELRGPSMPRPFAKGTSVVVFDDCIRTTLMANHPAGSTVLRVANADGGFKVGQTIGIAVDSESGRIAALGTDTITLAAPTTKDHVKGDLVGVVGPRKLFWGMYHALFVTVMLTDAMRKSGFR